MKIAPPPEMKSWLHPVTGYTLFVMSQCDVIFTFANQCLGEVCCHNMRIQRRWSSDRAGGAVKELRARETSAVRCVGCGINGQIVKRLLLSRTNHHDI